jgi:hypothetical protein
MIRLNSNRPIAAEVKPDPNLRENERPAVGSQTPRQDLNVVTMSGTPFANGNKVNNPCGFPGYGGLYDGSYPVYRFMIRHPRLAHVRRKVFGKILANQWGWVVKNGTPENVANYARDTLTRLRRPYLVHALRSLDFGQVTFEKVWDVIEGRWVITDLKPLSVDTTVLAVDEGGRFAGVYPDGKNSKLFNRRKSVHVVYDPEGWDVFGNSRLENIRETAWRDWLDCATQLMYLSYKISGKLAVILAPAGKFIAPDGVTQIDWREQAIAAGKAIADPRANNVVYMPTMAIPDNRSKENIDLAKIPIVSIDVKDFGSHGEAVGKFLERLAWNEDLMYAGYYQSSRSGMQSKHGSRADSESQTEDDVTDPEITEGEEAEAYNEQIVDDSIVLNFGPKWREHVRAVPASMRDKYAQGDWKILDAVLLDDYLRPELVEKLGTGIDAIVRRRGIAVEGDEPIKLTNTNTPDPSDETPEEAAQRLKAEGQPNGGAAAGKPAPRPGQGQPAR